MRNSHETQQTTIMDIMDEANLNLWEMPEICAVNRLTPHATFHHFASAETALGRDPKASPWFLDLNGDWKFKLVDSPKAPEAQSFMRPSVKTQSWDDITVPGNWTMQCFDHPHYTNSLMPFPNYPPHVPEDNPTGLYRTTFTLPKDWMDRRTVIHFGGVESAFFVYVNGKECGFAKDSRTPSEFDITDVISSGDNTLAVKVIRWSDGSFIEDQDHWWMAGIYRDVFLYCTPCRFVHGVPSRPRP